MEDTTKLPNLSIQRVGVHFAVPHSKRLIELQAAGAQLALTQVSSEAKLISTVPAGPNTRFTFEINGDVRRFEFNLEGANPHVQGIACREPLNSPPPPSPVIITEPEETLEVSATHPAKGRGVAGGGASQSYSYEGAVSAISGVGADANKGSATILGSDDSWARDSGRSNSSSVMVLFLFVIVAAVVHTQRSYLLERFPNITSKLTRVAQAFKLGGNDKGVVSPAECKGIVSAAENEMGGAADAEDLEARPMAKAPRTLPVAAAISLKRKWKVTLDLGASPWSIAVAKNSISSVDDVKQLIFEACVANVGADLLPKEWMAGSLASMQVQFLDQDVRMLASPPPHDPRLVQHSSSSPCPV